VRLKSKSRSCFSLGRTAKAALSAFLILQIFTLLALAACPALHHALHHDSDRADHDCAVTIFAHGHMDSSIVDVASTIPATPIRFVPLISAPVFHELVETLPPGRAPPVSLLPS
jgi:hypothetical protein